MKMKQLGRNTSEITTDRYVILFSYNTPVAYLDLDHDKCFVTETKYSRTTSKHISKWLPSEATEVPQQQINDLFDRFQCG